MKAFTTFVFFILCIATYAQKVEFKTYKDLESEELSTNVYNLDLDAKTIKIKFDDGRKQSYKIKDIEVLKNEKDEELFPDGITYTEYNIELIPNREDIYEMQMEIQFLTIQIPKSNSYYGMLTSRNHYMISSDYYSVEKTK